MIWQIIKIYCGSIRGVRGDKMGFSYEDRCFILLESDLATVVWLLNVSKRRGTYFTPAINDLHAMAECLLNQVIGVNNEHED